MPQKIKPKQKMVQGEMTGKLMPESERRQREMLMTREMERIRKSQGGKTVLDMDEEEEEEYKQPTSSKRVVAVVTGGKGEVKPKATKMIMEAMVKRVQKLKK
jgi:selenophosphate synthase